MVPGILGSRLARRDAEGKLTEIWGTGALRLAKNLATFGRAIKGLAVELPDGKEVPDDGVEATGVITDLAVVPGFLAVAGYDGLVARLENELRPGQVVAFAYDWRLSNRLNGERFAHYLERELEDWRKLSGRGARAVVIAHSMGGLVARWAIEVGAAHRHVSRLITLGTPFRGAAAALDALANGVRLPAHIGPRFDAVVESFPSVRELLPTYRCVRCPPASELQSLGEAGVVKRAWVDDGLAFHDALADAVATRDPARTDELIPLVGNAQATPTTAVLDAKGRLRMFTTIDATERGRDWLGDGTVPSDSAAPPEWDANRVRSTARPNGQQHASMQVSEQAWRELGWLLWDRPRLRDGEVRLGLRVPDVAPAGAPLTVNIDGPTGLGLVVEAVGIDGVDPYRATVYRRDGDGGYEATLCDLPPDVYTVSVRPFDRRAKPVEELSTVVTVYTED
ncbi:MAG: esterase/lipase family protein [Acidimicrobiales bacterium]